MKPSARYDPKGTCRISDIHNLVHEEDSDAEEGSSDDEASEYKYSISQVGLPLKCRQIITIISMIGIILVASTATGSAVRNSSLDDEIKHAGTVELQLQQQELLQDVTPSDGLHRWDFWGMSYHNQYLLISKAYAFIHRNK